MKLILIFTTLFLGYSVFGAVLPEEATSNESKSTEFVLPANVKSCVQDDPDLNQCLKDTIQQQLPLLHKGSTTLNIPPLDPFEILNNRIEYSNGAISGTVILKNFKVYGMSRTIIKDVRAKITDDGLTVEIDAFVPKLYVEGNYKADVKVNDIKMRPKGYFNATLSDIGNTAKFGGSFEIIDGNRHLRLTEFDVDPEIGDMKIFATGLFPDPTLNSIVLDFVNQYWPETYKILLPETKVYWEPIVLEHVNQFFLRVPFDKLLTKSD